MATLYPPYLEGKLPAQIGDTLRIPFEHNRAVGDDDYTGIRLYVKNIYTNNLIDKFDFNGHADLEFVFKMEENPFTIGQYYKAQLAYLKDGEVGVSSTVGVFKYTAQPVVTVEQLNEFVYAGSYINEHDLTEKVYSYRFDIYDDQDNLYETSGELIHNASRDSHGGVSTDEFRATRSLDKFRIYRLVYTVKTINDLVVASNSKSISKPFEYPYDYGKSQLIVAPNNDEGYNTISVNGSIEEGYYRVMRSTDQRDWVEVCRRALAAGTKELFRDLTVDHAQVYYYYLQRFDPVHNIYAEPLYADPVQNLFEDAFLSDGKRQLKVRFNPKISSIKTTTLESKMDTIGGKYPFFFRNGSVGYKEFPISGLISLLMDDNSMFTLRPVTLSARKTTPDASKDEIERATNLTPQNFYNERHFKLDVLEWLNNGEPKLFRSAAEGTYIVRLMNVSLSPNDTLGRMLHTFSSTAYEIADYGSAELKKLGFFEEDFSLTVQNTTDLKNEPIIFDKEGLFELKPGIVKKLTIHGAINAQVQVDYSDGKSHIFNTGYIGYYALPDQDKEIAKITIFEGDNSQFINGCSVEYITNRTVDSSFKDKDGKVVESYKLVPEFIQLPPAIIAEEEHAFEVFLGKLGTYLRISSLDKKDGSLEFTIDDVVYDLGDKGMIIWTVKDFNYNYLPFDRVKIGDGLKLEAYYYKQEIEQSEEVASNAE